MSPEIIRTAHDIKQDLCVVSILFSKYAEFPLRILWALWREGTGTALLPSNLNNIEHVHNYRINCQRETARMMTSPWLVQLEAVATPLGGRKRRE